MDADGKCNWGAPSASDAYIMLAKDPESGLYEHPVAIYDEGSHENWPNSTGYLTGSNKDGGGVSFLPNKATYLGSVERPEPEHAPFLFYNGKFGNDPQAIALHKTLLWPGGRESNALVAHHIAATRFTDADPYEEHGDLEWPPGATSAATDVFVVPGSVAEGETFTGTQANPYPGLDAALSLAPAGSTVWLATGVYRQALRLARPLLLRANGGVATLEPN